MLEVQKECTYLVVLKELDNSTAKKEYSILRYQNKNNSLDLNLNTIDRNQCKDVDIIFPKTEIAI